MDSLIMIAAAVVLGWVLIKIITKPIGWAFKFFIHAALGYILLFIFNFFGCTYGLVIELNLVTAAIAGFGGIPGVILLLIAELIL